MRKRAKDDKKRKNINMNVNTNVIQNLVLENRKKLSVN